MKSIHQAVQATIDSFSAHIALLDARGMIIAVNVAWRRFADSHALASTNYAIGVNYLQVCESITGADAGTARHVAEGIRSIVAGQSDVFTIEYPCHSPEEQRWFMVRITPFAADGPIRVVVAHDDITIRKQAEELLDASRWRLQAVFDNVHDAILLVDDTTRFVDANQAACVLVGYTYEELLQLTVRDIMPPASREQLGYLWSSFLSARCGQKEYIVCRKDGTLVDVEYRAVANILPGLHVSLLQDVSERKRMQTALEARVLQQAAIADFGKQALRIDNVSLLMDEAVACVARTLNVEFCAVLKLLPDATTLQLLAGVGWHDDLVGRVTLPVNDQSVAGYTLRSGGPVIIEDLTTETRFRGTRFLHEHAIRSGLSVIIHHRDRPFGLLSIYTTIRRTFTKDDIHFIQAIANVLAVAMERIEAEQSLHRYADRLMEAQETERRQLAQELHDQVGQILTGLNINLNVIQDQLSEESRAKLGPRIEESLQLLAEAIGQIRNVMTTLRPAVLDDYGLPAALRWYGRQYAERTGINVQVDITDGEGRLETAVEIALFRVAQEALTNVAKHAQATKVTIRLALSEHQARLTITDNGIGFRFADLYQREQPPGLGLIGMRERMDAVSGKLHIEAELGAGTRIVAELERGDGDTSYLS